MRDDIHMSSRGRTFDGDTTTTGFPLRVEAFPACSCPFSIVAGSRGEGNSVNTGTLKANEGEVRRGFEIGISPNAEFSFAVAL